MKFGSETFLNFTELPAHTGLARTKCRELYNKFKMECERSDSKFSPCYYVELSVKTKWVHEDGFNYFIANYRMLQDESARKRVAKYTGGGISV